MAQYHQRTVGSRLIAAVVIATMLASAIASGCSGGSKTGQTVAPKPPPEDTLGLIMVAWSTSKYARTSLWDCEINGSHFVLGDTGVVVYGALWQQTALVGYDRRKPLSITISSRTVDSNGNRAFGHYRYPPQYGIPDSLHETCYRAPQVLECNEYYDQPIPGYGTVYSLLFFESYEDYAAPHGGWPPTIFSACDTTIVF